MKLEINGKESSGKRTCHFEIKYFYITDLIKRGLINIDYCSSNLLRADYMTKPLIDEKFKQFRGKIFGSSINEQQECVE
jgi:hypothetical protein